MHIGVLDPSLKPGNRKLANACVLLHTYTTSIQYTRLSTCTSYHILVLKYTRVSAARGGANETANEC